MNYVVRSGDTLNSIAARFGVSVQELIRVNNVAYPYYIYVGQNLYIPITPTPAPGGDVERRLNRLENRVDALREDYRRLDNRVDRLENRVTRLERATTPTQPPRPRPTATPRPR
ncbi:MULTISPECIES: LysM peptidoglycan-binding domain-containing protein [Bacillales]|uniref:LysM peptidoglycan-binding domain-containing protein n=1 Tax=Bacillales TaxID=1385 RepID=UPI000344905F|nr:MULTISPECIES: LysM peptidoglycan-binding domain-containing protein [Bacillales]KMZ41512.1 peptidoglycan-binding protein LysM [Bacillus sp. FJAT-27238]MBH0329551.1 peptidoglycan-binding protein LysM [Brevibacillus brevis]OUQ86226.1 peptidoglycan-binding protein LysM [Brevibacillus brevis]